MIIEKALMPNIDLTICIPTYNRCNYLVALIEEIIKQILKDNLNVEVCISDNKSNDNTKNIIEDYSNKYKFINININKSNYGFDFNLCRVIEMANGKYIWLLSDDDIIIEEAIMNVYRIIRQYDNKMLSVIFLQPLFLNENQIANRIRKEENNIFDNIDVFNEKEEFLIKINWLISFMSSFIIKNKCNKTTISKFINTGFIHIPFIIDRLFEGKISIINRNVLLIARQNNSSSYDIYKYFGVNFNSIIKYYYKNEYFNRETYNIIINSWLKSCVSGNIKKNKENKSIFKSNIMYLIKPYIANKYFITRILPVIFLPRILVNILIVANSKIVFLKKYVKKYILNNTK